MKAIITGATGMLGSHLAALLTANGIPVKALIRNKQKVGGVKKIFNYYSLSDFDKTFEFAEVDLTNPLEVECEIQSEDWVFNCAAQVSFDPRLSQRIIDQNVAITHNLVNVCLEKNVAAFCHVSSVAALGKNPTGGAVNETCFWKAEEQNSAYGYSKYLSENEVWRGIEEGLRALIVNPSIILGEGFWQGGSGAFWSAAAKNKNRFYPPGSAGFVDVKDVARAMLELVKHQKFGERYIINAQNLTYKEFFTLLNQSLNLPPPKYAANKSLLELAWRLNGIISRILNQEINFSKETARAACELSAFDGLKVRQTINFNYSNLHSSIQRISQIFHKEHNSN